MIVAGLLLLAVGSADLARQFLRRPYRLIVLIAIGVAILVLGILCAAWPASLLAVAVAVAWLWLFPAEAPARAGFWPAIVLAIACGAFVAALGSRQDAGLLGSVWRLPTPFGPLSIDHTVLTVGAICILLESGNVIVRAALASEIPLFAPAPAPATAAAPASAVGEADGETTVALPTLKGGRLIGPLERVIVFSLTLSGVYALLAAVLAAKGIVRFPEISRDGGGDRAEYFLIGSLVSWVIALAAAFLVWWGFTVVP